MRGLVIRQLLTCLLLACGLIVPVTAQTAGLLRNMVCDLRGGIKVEEGFLGTGRAFEASEGTLILDPKVFYNLPQIAANYEFGEACLAAVELQHDACSVVEFLRQRDLIYYSDLEVLQAYFEDRAANEADPSEQEQYYLRIKELYGCF